jgi:hypothetical protein
VERLEDAVAFGSVEAKDLRHAQRGQRADDLSG